jgi:hypothetical protein
LNRIDGDLARGFLPQNVAKQVFDFFHGDGFARE